jgi:biopolymer transport protein ExbB
MLLILSFAALLCPEAGLNAQNDPDTIICIDRVQAENPHGGFLGLGKKVDLRVKWKVMANNRVLSRSKCVSFKVLCSPAEDFGRDLDSVLAIGQHYEAVFKDRKPGEVYHFKAVCYDSEGDAHLMSDTYTLAPSTEEKQPNDKGISSFFRYSWNAFGGASVLGQFAFVLILLFLPIGFITWFFRTCVTMRAVRIFPEVGELDDFVKTLGESVESGDNRVIDLSKKPEEEPNCRLRELLREKATVKAYRGDSLLVKALSGIVDPLLHSYRRKRWKPKDLPTFRIARVGIAALKKADSKESVQDAMESRIVAEVENLRKRSFIDLLWAVGVAAPLLGLFGTVTGLSFSFLTIVDTPPDDPMIIKLLSAGIFEALFTTIWGLIAGVLSILSYYYYNYKLDRVHSTWQMYAMEFVDRFKYELRPTP